MRYNNHVILVILQENQNLISNTLVQSLLSTR